ncbi:MAG TPA: hypothetical protein VGD91_24640 [Trebonia sp.]
MNDFNNAPDRPVSLSDATLHLLPGEISKPSYSRADLKPAVVHIGVGGFHRAHQGVYFDDLVGAGATGTAESWYEIEDLLLRGLPARAAR